MARLVWSVARRRQRQKEEGGRQCGDQHSRRSPGQILRRGFCQRRRCASQEIRGSIRWRVAHCCLTAHCCPIPPARCPTHAGEPKGRGSSSQMSASGRKRPIGQRLHAAESAHSISLVRCYDSVAIDARFVRSRSAWFKRLKMNFARKRRLGGQLRYWPIRDMARSNRDNSLHTLPSWRSR